VVEADQPADDEGLAGPLPKVDFIDTGGHGGGHAEGDTVVEGGHADTGNNGGEFASILIFFDSDLLGGLSLLKGYVLGLLVL
jgi:hypothetical protein